MKPTRIKPVIRALSVAVLIISLLSFISHGIGIKLLREWGFDLGMAFNTTVCLVLMSMCMLLISRSCDD